MRSGVGVIGAGGQTGRRIVAHLSRHGTRGLVHGERSTEAARQAGASETVPVGIGDRASLTAVAGLDTLVFIAPPFDADEEVHAANAHAAASATRVGHLIYYSLLHANLVGLPHHVRKLNVEARIRASGLRWTIVQPAMYPQSLLGYVRDATDGARARTAHQPRRPLTP